jgi:hypothetical protein
MLKVKEAVTSFRPQAIVRRIIKYGSHARSRNVGYNCLLKLSIFPAVLQNLVIAGKLYAQLCLHATWLSVLAGTTSGICKCTKGIHEICINTRSLFPVTCQPKIGLSVYLKLLPAFDGSVFIKSS